MAAPRCSQRNLLSISLRQAGGNLFSDTVRGGYLVAATCWSS
jgi:hypothetical protein